MKGEASSSGLFRPSHSSSLVCERLPSALKGPGRTARGVSPGTTDEGRSESPARAAQVSASPLQGLVSGCGPLPGLTPWALLQRPFRAHSAISQKTSQGRILLDKGSGLADRTHFGPNPVSGDSYDVE